MEKIKEKMENVKIYEKQKQTEILEIKYVITGGKRVCELPHRINTKKTIPGETIAKLENE